MDHFAGICIPHDQKIFKIFFWVKFYMINVFVVYKQSYLNPNSTKFLFPKPLNKLADFIKW